MRGGSVLVEDNAEGLCSAGNILWSRKLPVDTRVGLALAVTYSL